MTPRHASGAALLALALTARASVGADAPAPGAYCPFPKQGETPRCLEPAQDEYREFFTALAAGEVRDDDVAKLEQDVASGSSSDTPYLALSSLSYGYYRLAERAAARAGEDPAVIARLQRWNALLARAYDVSERDPHYRAVVHEATQDLHERAPRVLLQCSDPAGGITECNSTEAVLRGFNRAGERVGLRGAIARLIERIFGKDDP